MLKSNSKKILIIALLLFMVLSLSAVSAEDTSDIGNATVASTDTVAQSATQVSAVQDSADTISEVSTDDSSTMDITEDITDQSNDKLDGADTIDTVSSNADKKNLLTSTKLEDEDHVIYVSPYGPDDGDGTMLRSFNTIKKALDSMNETGHYTIVLRNGNYTGINNTALNISRDNVTIKIYDRAKVIIDNYQSSYCGWNITGSNVEIQGITFNRTYYSSRYLNILKTENVTISDCTFVNGSYGNSPMINIENSKNITIEDSTFKKLGLSTSSYVIGASGSDITIKGNEFVNLSTSPINIANSNATISDNHFDNFTGNYGIYSSLSNSTIKNNIFENRNTSYYSPLYIISSNSNISGNTFKNLYYGGYGNGRSPIYVSSSVANISGNDFINTHAYYGGAIENSNPNTIVENNRFINTSAYMGGAIYNTATNLTLTGNTASGTNATQGDYVYNNYTSGNINTVNVTFLNNETVTTDSFSYPISVLVTDDMGNKIFGKTVSVYLNDTSRGSISVGDDEVYMNILNPGQGTYLINGNYSGALHSNVKTGVIEFLDSYEGPFYVATNGSDTNNGDKDHPFKTINAAIRAASMTNNTHVIYINEGTYYENNLSVSTGLNITGLGNVTIDGSKGGRILYVSGANTNISNINFENANYVVSTSNAYGGAVYWTGANGTLNNASFSNNLLNNTYSYSYSYGYGGAVCWSGVNGTINNTSFTNNTVRMYSGYSDGGAVYWSGVNGTIANSTFDDNTAFTSSSSYNRNGGAVYWSANNGHLTDNKFNNNTAYYGANIYVTSNNLTLSGNEISNPNGHTGEYIYVTNDYASINGAVVTILNNSTVNTSMPFVDCLVTVTDDMGNPIYGGLLNVTLNGTKVISNMNIYENATVTINATTKGEYLVTPVYYHRYATLNDNYTAKTAVINWTDTPYYGPYYVATDGSDSNSGSEDSPFATIETAIKAASLNNATHAIFIKEGTYKENDLNITKPINITGIGKVIIDAEDENDIFNISANYVNLTNIGFINGYSDTDGGALYVLGNFTKIENCSFENNTADGQGGAIYNKGNCTVLSGNNITNCEARVGNSIYNNGSINGTRLVLLNNETITLPEGVTAAQISVKLVDDMNNSIAGGYVNVTLNHFNATLMQNLTDDLVLRVFTPGYGEYLVNGSYRTLPTNYNPDRNNYTVETGMLTFLSEPYYGPYYVDPNGNDDNDGSREHPFKTIGEAIRAASQDDVENAIFVNEGVYNETNLTISKPLNITGLGNVVLNGEDSNTTGLTVMANDVNISNIEFTNYTGLESGSALAWVGNNGTLNNATFFNNSATGTAGAMYWTGHNGVLNNSKFINNTAPQAGAIDWSGVNGTLVNTTFINNTATEGKGGAITYRRNLNITNNTFINNSAYDEGGAIYTNLTGPVLMANSTFINNSAKAGGAIFVDFNDHYDKDNLYNNTNFNIVDSRFINNTAQLGGAVVLDASNSTIANSIFIGNNATRYGDGAVSSGGENNTIINNTFINNTAFLYAGAIGSNSSTIVNNRFINNSAYQAGAILTINDTIINNTFTNNKADSVGASIVYLQDYNLTNKTDNSTYLVLLNNTLDNRTVYVYGEDRILNVSYDFNGVYFLTDIYDNETNQTVVYNLTHAGYCIEANASLPWNENGTTGILVHDLRFVRNSLDGSYVGDYLKVLIMLYDSRQRFNIKELVHVFTDEDYMHSGIEEIQRVINLTNDEDTTLSDGDNYINGTWYCHAFASFINPTTRQNLILINACGDFELPHLEPKKEANVTTVDNEDYINYTITVTNENTIYLHNVTVHDIPDSAHLVYVGWNNTMRDDNVEEAWVKDNESLTWYLNRTLLPGETVRFYVIFKAIVPIQPYHGQYRYDILNTINVTSYETNYDIADETVEALIPYLVIRKDTLDPVVGLYEPARFLITVTNIGEGVANEVHVAESGWASYALSYLGWSNGFNNRTWTYGPNSYNWYLDGSLAPGESANFIVIFNATSTGYMYYNTALVTNPGGPTEYSTNFTNVSLVYLGAYKSVLDTDVSVGDNIKFLLTVSNYGNSTAYDAYIVDNPMGPFNFVSWEDSRGSSYNYKWSYSNNRWQYSDPLAPGDIASIIVTYNIYSGSPGATYSNGITVGDRGGSKNGTSVQVNLANVYLMAHKEVLTKNINVGDNVSFLLTVTNVGNASAQYAYIQEEPRGPFNFVSWADTTGNNSRWSYSNNRWTLMTPLAAGASASVIVTYNVYSGSQNTYWYNHINVGDNYGQKNSTDVQVNISTVYLGAYKYVVEQKGDTITFGLSVTNNGNTTARNVYIQDTLSMSGYFTVINWTDSRGPSYNNDWSYNGPSIGSAWSGGSPKWTLLTPLAPGASATIFIKLNTTNAISYSNGITVGDNFGSKNGTGIGDTFIRTMAAYKKVVYQADDIIKFELTVINTGNTAMEMVYIDDTLSTSGGGSILMNWTDSRGSEFDKDWTFYGPSINSTWSSGTVHFAYGPVLQPSESRSVIVTLNTTTMTGYSNGITVGDRFGSKNGTGIGDSINRYLSAQKTVLDQNVTVGEPIRFLLTVTNIGNTTCDQVYIVDTPRGPLTLLNWTDYRGSSYDSEWTQRSTNQWVYNNALKAGQSRSLILTFNVTAAGSFSNGMTVGDRFGSRNGTDTSFNVSNVYLGAYKELLDETIVYGEPVRFLLAVTNNGNGTAHGVYIQESPSLSTLEFLNWTDSRGSQYNSDWYYDGNYKWTYRNPLGAGGTASIVVTFNVTAQSSSSSHPGVSNSITVGDQVGPKNGTGNGWGIEYIPLGIYKNALNETPIRQGDNLSFLITVKNNGNGGAHHVWINETPDWDSLEFLNWTSMDSHTWTFNGTFEYNETVLINDEPVNVTKKCLIFTLNEELAADESANLKLTFNVTAPNGGTFNSVTTGDNSTNGPKNGTGWNGYITNEILGLTKAIVDEGKVIYVGGEAKFVITVTNIPSGPDSKALNHIFVVEDAPEGLEYQNFTVITGEEENRLVGTWTHMVNDEGKHVFYLEEGLEGGYFSQIEVTFIANKAGNFTNKVNGSSDQVNNTTEENYTVYDASLAVEKIALDPVVYAGNTSSFMIVVHNTGNTNLTSVTIEEAPQEGLIYLNFTSDDDKWFYDADTHKFIYADTLLPGASTNFTVIFNTTKSGTFINTVIPSSNETGNKTGNATNNTTVYTPKLEVEKITLNETVYNGNITQFTIVVTNVGDCNLTEVFVKEESYEGLTYVDFVDETGKWSYDKETGIFTYDGTLGVEASANFTVLFNTTRSGNFTNVVIAGSNETGNETTENKTEVLTPGLDVYKYANNATVYNGNITEFTVVVTNTGDCNLTGVFVEEQIPEGLIYVDFVDDTGKWSYDEESHVFTYDGTLVPEEVVKFVILFNTTRSGNFTNVIVYGSNQTGNDTNESNKTTVYSPKMEVIKVASDKVVYVGNTTSYTIEVTNTGDCDLSEVFVEEQVPEGLIYLTYVDKVGHWNYDGNYKWTYDGVLASEETVSFIIIFNTTVSMNITNVVIAGSNETGNETAENNTTVVYSPKFEVEKISLNETVYNGNITQFTIVVTNTGDCNLTGVFVKEDFPEELIYVDFVDDSGKWSYDEETNTFTYDGTLELEASVEFTVLFNTTKSGNFTNVVVAGSKETGNETTENTTEVLTPDFVVIKVANDEVVYVGNPTSYTITVTNTGDCDLTNVFVDDKTPEGLVYLGYDKESEWDYDGSSVWTYTGVLAPGESASLVITYNTTKSMNITNVVTAGSDVTGNKTTENDTTKVYSPDFVVIKVASDEVVYVGNTTSYTITVTNTGDCDLSGVFVDDKTPDGLVYLGYTDEDKWTFDGSSVWTYTGVLAPGESASLVITYNTTKSMNIDNVVTAGTDETGNKTTNNNTTNVFSPDFEVVKVASDDVVYSGNITSFTIIVSNTGDCALTGVFVKENFPDGLTYLFFTPVGGNWTFDESTQVYSLADSLEIGSTASFMVFFNTSESGNFTNPVEAGSDLTGNKTANDTVTVYNPGLTVQKITLNETVYVGEKTQFLIHVVNTGDCDLTGVYVIEKSFPGLKYGSYVDYDGKWEFDGKNKWIYKGTLKAGESADFIVIFDTSKAGNFTNTVEAGSDQTGPEEADNDTEVIDKEVPDKPDDKDEVPDKPVPNEPVSKHSGKLSSIKSGNPLIALLLVFAILGLTPLRRKRE